MGYGSTSGTLLDAPLCQPQSLDRRLTDSKPVLGLSYNGFYHCSRRINTVGNEAHSRLRKLLIHARKQAGITQADLATRLKRPQSFVSKYERGERRLDLVEFGEVAKALGTDPVRFLGRFYGEET